MVSRLNIIEPTLNDEAGHCFSFINSLCLAAGDKPLIIWCGSGAKFSLSSRHVLIKRFFHRKIRRLQAAWLYRKLLGANERIFISTAGRTDLLLIDLVSRGTITPNKVFLYVHWFRSSPAKRAQLQKIARRHPEIIIFSPVASVCEEFRSAGFIHTRQVPYPITPREADCATLNPEGFKHILFAGAARQDKGFSEVVDLIAHMERTEEKIPITLQVSAEHYSKYDETTRKDIIRLDSCAYPYLIKISETLQHGDYRELFSGAICLQLYSQQDFADRISGVTLDALNAGSPVVTLAGTWMARIVTEFEAGVVITSPEPETVLGALKHVREQYEFYRNNASEAGSELQRRNSAEYLFKELTA